MTLFQGRLILKSLLRELRKSDVEIRLIDYFSKDGIRTGVYKNKYQGKPVNGCPDIYLREEYWNTLRSGKGNLQG